MKNKIKKAINIGLLSLIPYLGYTSDKISPQQSMWVWYHRDIDNIVSFCKEKNIDTIYISAHKLNENLSYFNELNKLMKNNNIKVFATISDSCNEKQPNSLHNNFELLKNYIDEIKKYNNEFAFDGIELDLEINFIDYTKRRQAYEDYLETLKKVKEIKDSLELRICVSKGWALESSKTIEQLEGIIDSIDYMAYTQYIEGNSGENMLFFLNTLAKKTNLPIYYGVLFNEYQEKTTLSFYEEGTDYMYKQIDKLWNKNKFQNLKGFAFHDYDNWKNVEEKNIK